MERSAMQTLETERFFVGKETDIILYGAAAIGSLMYTKLTDNGYHITAFMDMRAEEMKELHGLPVYLPEMSEADRDSIIIISVKNVFEHSRIASRLVGLGFEKLIYRPFNCLNGNGTGNDIEINQAYDKLENGILEGLVPISKSVMGCTPSLKGVLYEDDTSVTAYVPIILIFSDKKEGVPEFPILFLKPHLDFVQYVLGSKDGDTKGYVDFCEAAAIRIGGFETTEAWKDNVIRNRAEVYTRMNHMYNLEKDFFVLHAPDVVWNEEKRAFNLKSGKHRATFLEVKGANYIAVKMSKGDFDQWVNSSGVEEIGMELNQYGEKACIAPIENPFFYEYAWASEAFWYELTKCIMKKVRDDNYCDMYTESLARLRVFIGIYDNGFLKRFFKRCGCSVYSDDCVSECEPYLNLLMNFEMSPYDEKEEKGFEYAIIEAENIKKITAKTVFVISDCDIHGMSKVMNGIYRGRQVGIYLGENAVL